MTYLHRLGAFPNSRMSKDRFLCEDLSYVSPSRGGHGNKRTMWLGFHRHGDIPIMDGLVQAKSQLEMDENSGYPLHVWKPPCWPGLKSRELVIISPNGNQPICWDRNYKKLKPPAQSANDPNACHSGLLWVLSRSKRTRYSELLQRHLTDYFPRELTIGPQSIVNDHAWTERSWNTSMFAVVLLIQERDRSHGFLSVSSLFSKSNLDVLLQTHLSAPVDL